ncbi:hypothetical protein ACMSI6_04370 [Pseudomonas antarctica]|nr:hypothetical protein [Pseudomonas antarctica]
MGNPATLFQAPTIVYRRDYSQRAAQLQAQAALAAVGEEAPVA